jgi:hypothetical protein
MVREAESAGLIIEAAMKAAIIPATTTATYCAPSALATIHESLTGLWWIVEFVPLPTRDPTQGYETHWVLHRGHPRRVPEGANLHQAILDRITGVPGYAPTNIPTTYTTVT